MTSCSRYYYQPNAVHAPMLKEKNDLKIGINGNFGQEDFDNNESFSSVVNFNAAYSPVKHLGIMTSFTNYRYNLDEENAASGEVDAHATLFEAGVGGYYPVVENEKGLKLVADTYIGYGGGKLKSDVNMNFDRIFIQPGINLTFPFFDVGLAGRFSGIKYKNFNNNGMSQDYLDEKRLLNITDKRHFFFEPALTLRGGYKFIKAQFQVVKSVAFENVGWNYDDNMVTLGIQFSIEEFMNLKK